MRATLRSRRPRGTGGPCFLKKHVFFSQNMVRQYLVGAGLSGSLSCCHFLCVLACVGRFFEIREHSNFRRNIYANSLRRDPRTSFFALFSEGFSDALYIRNRYANLLRMGFFCNVETACVKDPIIDVGCGLLGDSLLWGIRIQSCANNKKKSSKTKIFAKN